MLALVFDTETTGRVDFRRPAEDPAQPWPVEVAWQLINTETWSVYQQYVGIVQIPEDVVIEPEAQKIHGISAKLAAAAGIAPGAIFRAFLATVERADQVVCHSFDFDRRVMNSLGHRTRHRPDPDFLKPMGVCTMKAATPVCRLPHANGRGGYKWPTLAEAHELLVGGEFEGSHSALADVVATTAVFRALVERGILPGSPKS